VCVWLTHAMSLHTLACRLFPAASADLPDPIAVAAAVSAAAASWGWAGRGGEGRCSSSVPAAVHSVASAVVCLFVRAPVPSCHRRLITNPNLSPPFPTKVAARRMAADPVRGATVRLLALCSVLPQGCVSELSAAAPARNRSGCLGIARPAAALR